MMNNSYFLIFQERKITKYSQTFPNKIQIKIECFSGAGKAMPATSHGIGLQN